MKENLKNINAGIYAILCVCTGLTYIGASARLVQRMHEQFVLLRSGRHYNKRMQTDWNNLGPDCFKIFPLELLADNRLLPKREKQWTAELQTKGIYNSHNAITERHRLDFDRIVSAEKIGMAKSATSNGKTYDFRMPNGEHISVRGLKGLCDAFGLNQSHMSKVARGIFVQHKGWAVWKPDKSVEQT